MLVFKKFVIRALFLMLLSEYGLHVAVIIYDLSDAISDKAFCALNSLCIPLSYSSAVSSIML